MNIEHPIHPKKCFCQILMKELKKWADKRFKDDIPTVELIDHANNDKEREIISIAALLDVDDQTLCEMMGDVDLPEHHIIHCRENVKKMMMELS